MVYSSVRGETEFLKRNAVKISRNLENSADKVRLCNKVSGFNIDHDIETRIGECKEFKRDQLDN